MSKGGIIMTKSIFGLSENIAALLSYLFGGILGIVILIMERENKFVRFHGMQAVLLWLVYLVVAFVVNIIPFISGILASMLSTLATLIVIFMMYKSFRGEIFKLPVIGEVAYTQVNKE